MKGRLRSSFCRGKSPEEGLHSINKEILCGLSLADLPFQQLDLTLPFFQTTTTSASIIIYSLVDCTTEAVVHQHGEFENFSTTLPQYCWSYLHWLVIFHKTLLVSWLCKHSEPKRIWLPRLAAANSPCLLPIFVTVWKHDNRSSSHAFLYVQTAQILMYIKNLINVSAHLHCMPGSCSICTNLNVQTQILMFLYICNAWLIF